MKRSTKPNSPSGNPFRGFALVVSLTMLVLLTVIAVGLLSLSAITLRTSTQSAAQAEAQANARLALMIAVGELQKQLGPDQRITANSDILSDATVQNPQWTGVWNSWRAGPSSDESDYPSDPSDHQTFPGERSIRDGMHPTYTANRRDHFRSWLLSLNPGEASDVNTPRSLALAGERMPRSSSQAVILVGQGSLGSAATTGLVSARLLPVKDQNSPTIRGRYGWWVGDESQKANIMSDSFEKESTLSLADRVFRIQAPASFGNSTIAGLGNINDESQLSRLPSRNTLGLVQGVTRQATEQFHDITTLSNTILADVREGGLKRDLSALLERKIDPDEVYSFSNVNEFRRATALKRGGNDFMLYNMDSLSPSTSPTGQANVPIQDLAAYYQLYNHYRTDGKGGIQYSSSDSSPSNSLVNSGIMASVPDHGETKSDFDKYLRQYTAPYRSVVPVKIEMILSYVTEKIEPAPVPNRANPNPDTHELRLGYTPAMTFWNPSNVPVVMNMGNPDRMSIMFRETPIPIQMTFKKSDTYDGEPTATQNVQLNQSTNTQQGELYTFFISGRFPVVFQPGETKVFSLQYTSQTDPDAGGGEADFMLRGRGNNRYSEMFVDELELVQGWNPERFVRPALRGGARGGVETVFTFKKEDYIAADLVPGNYNSFTVDYTQKSRHGRNAPGVMWHFRSFGIRSRLNRGNNGSAYKNEFVYMGFPNSTASIANRAPRPIRVLPRQASNLITAMGDPANPNDDLPQPFFYYGIKAATETHESQNMFPPLKGAGRRFPARPFTHSTPMAPVVLDGLTGDSLYNYGWNWFIKPLNNGLLDAPVSISRDSYGYFGGGYTAENGTTHVVQQYLPLTPPISIASLSNAHLGGFSLATEPPAAGYNGLRDPWTTEAWRRVTALGFGGLAPRTLQAIGNSYAHPNIPADRAWFTWDRFYSDQGSPQRAVEPFADHSYLANKALWDEFFFSSISPKPSQVRVFSQNEDIKEVARSFFFDYAQLPNRRIIPYAANMTEERLDALVTTHNQFRNGFADKIAAHLMVEGGFNINSTSEAAWKALFSSLKGKPVPYLDLDSARSRPISLEEDKIEGVPVAGGPVANRRATTSSSSDPSDLDQWIGWRELNEREIDALAAAMVKQVKTRGPFLSLSEFVNRRLDSRDKALSTKGALQAAIDDPSVPINDGFKGSLRNFSRAEISFVNAKFPEAMEGPIAYGSSAYVDQADVLRNFASQLTPRGDTFVIRAYGDSLDAKGNVLARAWCEATVQRMPDYSDSTDEPHIKQAELRSDANRNFGRKFTILNFRWLNHSEI